ncbi:MAG: F0F1 ATP synthase subunit A [Holosporales bacterium]
MANPLSQFTIKPLIPIEIAGYDVSFTNSSLAMVLTTLLILTLQYFSVRGNRIIPNRLQASIETLYSFVANILQESAGKQGMKYFPFVFSIFLFILFGNLLGMVPYSFTFTSHIIVTFALALFVFISVTLIGLVRHGLKFFSLFFPSGVPLAVAPILIPIEIISYLARPVTLSVRLFANMMAGHIFLKIFAGFTVSLGLWGIAPLAFNVVFTGFEFFVAMLQAYVFTVLTCIYLHDAIHLH